MTARNAPAAAALADLDRHAVVLTLIETAHALEDRVALLSEEIAALTGHNPNDQAVTDAIWNEVDATRALDLLMGEAG